MLLLSELFYNLKLVDFGVRNNQRVTIYNKQIL